MAKTQRLLDPIHGLIKFNTTDEEQIVWQLVNCREFQRLRRIRQLGFSEFVYPGATHTRFSHSIGVFHNARRLLDIIREKSTPNEEQAFVAKCSALLHDIGHGPFSHAFENASRALGSIKRHEEWTKEIIVGDTEINRVLRSVNTNFPEKVAKIIGVEESSDIYTSVVSSQFDADRLDYLKRDRYMTGIGSGEFDLEWMLDCLEVGEITIGQNDSDYISIPALYLNYKGYKAAEGYLQARFQLYSMVYFHKTTRAAEKMLEALLVRLHEIVKKSELTTNNISCENILVKYVSSEKLTIYEYLILDDSRIISCIYDLLSSTDDIVSNLACRILDRKLYKCIDLSASIRDGTDQKQRFRKVLHEEAATMGLSEGITLLVDDPQIFGYNWYAWDDENALKKVLVSDSEHKGNIKDIASSSRTVQALQEEKIFRVYVPNDASKTRVKELWKGVSR